MNRKTAGECSHSANIMKGQRHGEQLSRMEAQHGVGDDCSGVGCFTSGVNYKGRGILWMYLQGEGLPL